MIQWLWDVFIWPPRCAHEWERLSAHDLIVTGANPKRTVGEVFIYRCTRCCEFRKHKHYV